jgi:transcriptional regulator with XRE-family HTH domain
MNESIPSSADVRESLSGLSTVQVRAIADAAGVPFTTLWKIKTGETANPGIETVRRFYGAQGLIFVPNAAHPSASRPPAAITSDAAQA